MNESNKDNPLNMYRYEVDKQIMDDPDFYWWACKLPKWPEQIIGKDKCNVNH